MRFILFFFVALSVSSGPAIVGAADEGIDLGKATHVTVTGRVFDANSKLPLPQALVTLNGPFDAKRSIVGPDGSFVATAMASGSLGVITVAFSHTEYQEKYLDTILRDVFRGDVEIRVSKGAAQLHARKVDLNLACDGRAELSTKTLAMSPFHVICEGERTGVEFGIRGTTIGVLADGSFVLRIRNGQLQIRDATSDTVELRVSAAMLPR